MPSSARSAGHAPHTPAAAFRESGFLNVPRLPRFGRTPSVQSTACLLAVSHAASWAMHGRFAGGGLHVPVQASRCSDALVLMSRHC